MMNLKTSDFHFDLPKELIASEPLEQRSASRLMCVDSTGEIAHKHYTDLPDLLQPGDLLVFNNSKVIKARLYAKKQTGGKVEILIERILEDKISALAHVKGSKSLKEGQTIFLGTDLLCVGTRKDNLLELKSSRNWYDLLEEYGHIPLPPYMERADRAEDTQRYQTVYADEMKQGSVAAPTAGLHFDKPLLKRLEERGIKSTFVTLHVGAGTFQPVRSAQISDHVMHAERFEIARDVIEAIQHTKATGGRIIAVGTTSVRVLESVFSQKTLPMGEGHTSLTGETDIFITPGYEFQIIDGLMTNFHLPESTLIMLVSALMGRENILKAYNVAIAEKYRFFSYGDGMLLTT